MGPNDMFKYIDSVPLSKLYSPTVTRFAQCTKNRPVTVGVLLQFSAGDRLLTGTSSVFDVVRVQADAIVGVQQLDNRSAGDVSRFGC